MCLGKLNKAVFPKGSSVTQKHGSTELATLNLIDEVINPYVASKRKELKLPPPKHMALVIWEVSKDQMTDRVSEKQANIFVH